MFEIQGKHNTAVCFTDYVEPTAFAQILTLCNQEAFAGAKVRIMPDVHAGKGCVIGFTADLGEKVIPNIVGVDIACGLLTVSVGLINIDFPKLDAVIREYVPAGRNVNDSVIRPFDLTRLYCYDRLKEKDWIARSLGSLGGGNHFIEIDADESGRKYLVIHTGSRNLGKQVAEYYQNVAIDLLQGRARLEEETRKLISEYKAAGRQQELQAAIADLKKRFTPGAGIPKELCYLTDEQREAYLHDMEICQIFASVNRSTIARTIIERMGWPIYGSFETVHNYIDTTSGVVRKGAVSATAGKPLLIPINMRDGSLICVGRGNPDWNYSAPHGAGRVMSRGAAKKAVTMDEYRAAMQSIYSTSVCEGTLDESPMAYKGMDDIVKHIGETADIKVHIKPLYNFKASD